MAGRANRRRQTVSSGPIDRRYPAGINLDVVRHGMGWYL